MDTPLEMPSQVETGMPAAPVIIPLQGDCPDFRVSENGTVPFGPPGTRDRQQGTSDERQGTDQLPRFEFPELPAPGRQPPPMAIWPVCDCPETARACAELAESMCWRLPPDCATILAFSSPGDGDGKTSLLLSLAPELAKRVERGVLVVDAAFRKPDLTARLAISDDPTPLAAAPIHATNLPGLSVLPAPMDACWGGSFNAGPSIRWGGSCTATPCETAQLTYQQAAWIEQLRQNWPLVLVDVPSLEHVEAAAMLRRCDGVYLVVRLGHTARRAIAEAARVIAHAGGRLLGCVVVE
jgi:Mrp family chromosome partitioning ATPase